MLWKRAGNIHFKAAFIVHPKATLIFFKFFDKRFAIDPHPVTAIGRVVTMVSSVFGIAVIALPSGVITAGYLEEVNKNSQSETDENR